MFRTTLLLGTALLFSCGGKKEISSSTNDYFIFGSGGGFTGKYTEYRMHQNGLIEKMDLDNERYAELAKVNKKDLQPFFHQLHQLNLLDMEYDHPGNMTWYIEVHNEEKRNRVRWGDYKMPPQPELDAFFKKVHDYVLALDGS